MARFPLDSRRRLLLKIAGLAAVAAPCDRAAAARAEPAAAELRRRLHGALIARDDEHYEIWRQSMVWQALKPARFPALIVQAADESDVIATVKVARGHDLRVAVRSGGHSWCHASVREGGILLDLSRLVSIAVDAAARSAEVGPAVSGRSLIARLAPDGLAFPVAHCGSVAMGGYLLGGGQSWNWEAWGGRACYGVRAIDIVTADGSLVRADADREPDLLWAARGAGPGFFGAVTRYHLDLRPLPRAITTSTYAWPLERAPEIADRVEAVAAELPAHVEVLMFLAAAPPEFAGRCGATGKALFLSATAFVDTEAAARAGLAALTALSANSDCVTRDEFRPTPFEALFDSVDRAFTRDRYAADTAWSNAPMSQLIAALSEHVEAAPSAQSTILCEVKSKPLEVPDAAWSMHGRSYVAAYALWRDRQDDDANVRWLREAMQAIEPLAIGRFVSETDLTADPARAPGSFAPANWERLLELRRRYDPDGVFHDFPGRQ
jgi:FAD/FMN-containing dehydrogenase